MTKIQRGPVDRVAEVYDNFIVGRDTAPMPGNALANTHTPVLEVMIQCYSDSPETVYAGNEFGQHWEILAGAHVVIPVQDLQLVHVMSLGGTGTYNFMAGT